MTREGALLPDQPQSGADEGAAARGRRGGGISASGGTASISSLELRGVLRLRRVLGRKHFVRAAAAAESPS